MQEAAPEQARAGRSRLRVLEGALALFARDGYETTTFRRIAKESGVSVGLVCRYFPTKEHLVLALYDRLAVALEEWAPEMPSGTIAVRFRAVMEHKLTLVEAHRAALSSLAARAFDPVGKARVLGASSEVVRSKVAGVFWLAVCGATDAPPPQEGARTARMLYALHLLFVLLYLQEEDARGRMTRRAIDLAAGALMLRGPVLELVAGPVGRELDGIFGEAFRSSRALAPDRTASVVLDRLFRRRRLLPGVPARATDAARALHIARVQSFVDARQRIQLALPAFPAKAPNPRKVLGKLPDAAEALALESLAALLAEIEEAHAPGAELVICSDGHVFADLVGVSDADVKAYRRALEGMIVELGSAHVRIYGLEDAFGDLSPAKARARLLASYGESTDSVRARAKSSPVHAAQLDGIHRLLFEDELVNAPAQTRTQARKITRARAYEVVRRSDAWGALVATAFPRAVRLSIHPQPDVSPKIGVSLLPTDDAWLTPWHGVALFSGDRARLVHRSDAEARGAVVVTGDGPSYMTERPA
jgi:pyoverdine/dityrosine biosynthesis protein Dit1